MHNNLTAARFAIAYTFITNLDYLIIIPLLPSLVTHIEHYATVVAAILSLRVAIGIGTSFALPRIFSRSTHGTILCVAACAKGLAFLALLHPSTASLYAFAILAGIGSGLLRPSIRACLAQSTRNNLRTRYYQYLFIAMNAAVVVGPTLSYFVQTHNLLTGCFIGLAALEALSGFTMRHVLHDRAIDSHSNTGHLTHAPSIRECFTATLTLSYALEFLLYFAIGFMVSTFVLYDAIIPSLGSHRHFFLSYEGFALIAAFLIFIPISGRLRVRQIMYGASLCIGFGMLLAFIPVFGVVLCGLTLFACAECLALPQVQTCIAQFSSAQMQKHAFSWVTIAAACGEICGTTTAGFIIDGPLSLSTPMHNAWVVAAAYFCIFTTVAHFHSNIQRHANPIA